MQTFEYRAKHSIPICHLTIYHLSNHLSMYHPFIYPSFHFCQSGLWKHSNIHKLCSVPEKFFFDKCSKDKYSDTQSLGKLEQGLLFLFLYYTGVKWEGNSLEKRGKGKSKGRWQGEAFKISWLLVYWKPSEKADIYSFTWGKTDRMYVRKIMRMWKNKQTEILEILKRQDFFHWVNARRYFLRFLD